MFTIINQIPDLKSISRGDSSSGDAECAIYPNPFRDELKFEFVSQIGGHARIDMYDINGRYVQTIFDNTVEAGVSYMASFKPEFRVSGSYLYKVKLGDRVFSGIAIYDR